MKKNVLAVVLVFAAIIGLRAQGPPPHPEIAPASMQVTYQFGARGDMPPVTVNWYEGMEAPRPEGLPADQKEAVFLKVVDGLTFKEIGAVCGVSANTAASRYRYGIAKLREAVGEKT